MRLTIIILLLFIFFLELVRIDFLSDLDVPLDQRWLDIQNETASYYRQNLLLEDELLHKESLTTINQQARKQGFIPATFITF